MLSITKDKLFQRVLNFSSEHIYMLGKLSYLPKVLYHKKVEDLIKNPKNVGSIF